MAEKPDLDKLRARARTGDQLAALVDATHDIARAPGYLVVLASAKVGPSPESIAAFAREARLDQFTARQRLLSPCPRIFRREETAAAADVWIERLATLDIRAFVLPEMLLPAFKHQIARVTWLQKPNLVIEDAVGKRHTVPISEILCIVHGEVSERVVEERASGGALGETHAGRSTVAERTQVVIDLHLRNAAAAWRIEQDTFRYEALFPDRTGASAVLVREVLKRLQKALPAAPCIGDFARAQDVIGQTSEVLSSSVYLVRNWFQGMAHARAETRKTIVQSGAEAFDLYSLLSRKELE